MRAKFLPQLSTNLSYEVTEVVKKLHGGSALGG